MREESTREEPREQAPIDREPGAVEAQVHAPEREPHRQAASRSAWPDRAPGVFARPDAGLLGAALATGPLLVALALATEPDGRGFGTHEQLGLPPCGLRHFLGMPCPACGVTTAVVLALRGHPLESLRTQPFGTLVALVGVCFFVSGLYAWRTGRDLRPLVLWRPRWQRVGFVVAIVLAWFWKLAMTR